MKTLAAFVFTLIMGVNLIMVDDYAKAGDTSNNTKYQILRIKHRTQMGFDNNGRSVYKYISDKDVSNSTSDIGRYDVPENSTVREVHLGVDIRNRVNIVNHDKQETLKIGSITNGGKLKKARINVRVTGPIKYK